MANERNRSDKKGDRSRGDKGRGDKGGRGDKSRGDLIDDVIKVRRCAAVVKGGRRFSFNALVVVGDGKGRVGWGYGKANEVPPSVEKGIKDAQRNMSNVPVVDGTIPHRVFGRFGAAKVILIPAGPGTGVIAGDTVRKVCVAAGIENILTKSFGSNNPANLVKATLQAFDQLRSRQEIERLRGVTLS
ncbi:S5 DRBM domain-containing protein [Planctomycetales bacterium 10988]|nr:S5 DRBM domain-containing protein [Planctomycetales bacterium 10988]